MRFLLFLAVLLLNFNISAEASPNLVVGLPMPIEQINSSMSTVQKRVRESAVRVLTTGGGHGSGSYVVYKDMHLVFTAQHVSDGVYGSKYQILKGSETKIGTLIWSDAAADIAILRLDEEFVTISPMKWNPQTRMAEVGSKLLTLDILLLTN